MIWAIVTTPTKPKEELPLFVLCNGSNKNDAVDHEWAMDHGAQHRPSR